MQGRDTGIEEYADGFAIPQPFVRRLTITDPERRLLLGWGLASTKHRRTSDVNEFLCALASRFSGDSLSHVHFAFRAAGYPRTRDI